MKATVHALPSGDGYIRSVEPYTHTYYTHVKARWAGKSLLDIYCNEFGGYSKQYYEAAIRSGKILLSEKRVTPDHVLRNGQDILSHTIHLHEPPVIMEHPDIIILAETDQLLVVDKPSTMVVHPTGASRLNSLLTILELRCGRKLYTVHRLDRVTSGICLFAKSPDAAQKWTHFKSSELHKYYLARVKGRFPSSFENTKAPQLPFHNNGIINGLHTTVSTFNRRRQNAFGYWTSHTSLQDFSQAKEPMDWWLDNVSHEHWLHLACPTRVAQYKDNQCGAGSFDDISDAMYKATVKASQTAFGIVSYCDKTDSTLLVCKPYTGRSHQIRVHLQFLGHPIANDTIYGGDEWFVNSAGVPAHDESHAPLPQPDAELQSLRAIELAPRQQGEGLEEFVARVCPSCECTHNTLLCSFPKSRGIWLRAIKYQVTGGSPPETICSYQAPPPLWANL